MFRLAHLSDPHIGPLPSPTWRELASKRVVGYINWRRGRGKLMRGDLLAGLVADVLAAEPDHVAVTGDLVNIALKAELIPARAFLDTIGDGEYVSVVPGNHDAYVPGALARANDAWKPFMLGDGHHEVAWPYIRRRGGIALVGMSSARASAPFLATGYVSAQQERLLTDRLIALGHEGLFRVVMIHHPPFPDATGWAKRLVGASRVRRALRNAGAELVLHGHTHLATRTTLPGRDGPIPVIGVSAASQRPGGRKPPAGYNIFDIGSPVDGVWHITHTEHRLTPDGTGFVEYERRELTVGHAPTRHVGGAAVARVE
ncbi:metallophosphoesterase family protein [Methylobrevis albus]|uniref:Metallophosphoesterase n=1 Tax=Methylobrevis albus TaxID=2793297 RepID=A0A931I0D3_9HYPH|nr:metallophosphoesterase [Methylobrevis albus]MBH0236653.1 metallophosphoesterase [Methylobrevis albus]